MKKILFFLVLSVVLLNAAAQQTVINDPNVEVRTISGSFNEIKVSGGINIYLTQGNEEAIAVSANKEKYKQNIKTEVKGNTLHIFYDEPGGFQISLGNKEMKVYVSFKSLQKIKASGASDIHVMGQVDVPSLNIELSGASDFHGAVKTTSLSVETEGASDIKISGTAQNASIDASGASDVKGYDLAVEVCKIKASGASNIAITVNQELNARATGASNIQYKGAAVIKEMNSSGASSINKKG